MLRKHKVLFAGLALALISLHVLADPPVYWAKPIHGQVVDAQSGKPLEGVVVVARWVLFHVGIGHGGHGGALNTIETVTDRDGKYFIPGWGPRVRPPLAFLDNLDPQLRFVRSGYYPEGMANELVSSEHRNRSVERSSEWDGKVIRLGAFDGNWEKYRDQLSIIWYEGGDCFRECPRLIVTLDTESDLIMKQAPPETHPIRLVTIKNYPPNEREFFEKFKK